MCAAKISVLAIYMLSYMGILTCFVWCLLILFYYVIKMEIKQLKRFFFCLYFNPVLSRNSFITSVLQMYIVGNLVQQNSTCILCFGYVTFWLCRTSDNSKYFLHSLGLWDNEVDLYFACRGVLLRVTWNTWHIEGLKLMSQSFSQFSKISRSFCRISKSAWLSRARYMAVSSANNLTLDLTCSRRSFM